MVLGSYDYINYRLTGSRTIEANMALESGLFDLHSLTWDQDLLELFNVPESVLPPICSPSEVIGNISHPAATETGLLEGTPVVGGTADHVGAALAAGITEEGEVLIKFGSAGDILFCSDQLMVDENLYIDFHDIPGKFLINGCMATSGLTQPMGVGRRHTAVKRTGIN